MISVSFLIALGLAGGIIGIKEIYFPVTWKQYNGTISNVQHTTCSLDDIVYTDYFPCVYFTVAFDNRTIPNMDERGDDTLSWNNGDIICVHLSSENVLDFVHGNCK